MTDPIATYANIGVLGIVCMYAIYQYFRNKNGKKSDNRQADNSDAILKELKLQSSNHLTHVESAIREGNKLLAEKLDEAQRERGRMEREQIKVLTEISSKLDRR